MTTEDVRHQDGWRKSSYSTNGGECVEIAVLSREADRLFVMRDSKNPAGPRLYFTPAEWRVFASNMKADAFNDLA